MQTSGTSCQASAKKNSDRLIARQARETAKENFENKKELQSELNRVLQAGGRTQPPLPAPASRCCPYASVDEEREARVFAATEHSRLINSQLLALLPRLRKIKDLRQTKKIKHKLTVLMLYGILIFVYQFASRREANTEITRPMFEENLRLLFPELDDLPHADTLYRLLCKIDVSQIEQAHTDLIRQLIRKKKFAKYLINNAYPIAIDGTQKVGNCQLWSDSLQQRRVSAAPDDASEMPGYQFYVYVLEANFCFHNGMVIPLMSEFLDYQKGDSEQNKQDCEQRAFHRLAERIKKTFPRLSVLMLLDGLYPTGPVMERCKDYNWGFMIVLQNGSLPAVWEEYYGLQKLTPNQEFHQDWGERMQTFRWANDIRYEYGTNARRHLDLHVVVCQEQWQAIEKNTIVTKTATHAWVSSSKLRRNNLHQRCNLAARHRWGIEICNLVEKHQGYHYEHLFAQNWNAMRGYHYLMRLGHLLNTLARFSSALVKQHLEFGVRAFIKLLRSTFSGPWFDSENVAAIKKRILDPFQLRLT